MLVFEEKMSRFLNMVLSVKDGPKSAFSIACHYDVGSKMRKTRTPHGDANAQLQLLLEIHWACLITSNSTT